MNHQFEALDPADQILIFQASDELRDITMKVQGHMRDYFPPQVDFPLAPPGALEMLMKPAWICVMKMFQHMLRKEQSLPPVQVDENTAAFAAAMTRSPQTGRMSTGGGKRTGTSADPGPSRPGQPKFSPEPPSDDEAPTEFDNDYIGSKSQPSRHPHNSGLNKHVLSCTGALMAVLGRGRANLWQWHQAQGNDILPVRVVTNRHWGNDWNLHDDFMSTMQFSHQHSLFHAAMP